MAFVYAATANTTCTGRTFGVMDALTDRMTARCFGETGIACWTFANVSGTRWTEFAHSRFGTIATSFDCFTASIGNRIASVAGWTLTHWRLVFSYANGIFATCALVANVDACMRESIAQFRWWTVDVIDAWHALASGRQVVWIAIVWPWRTLTFGVVIVADADRLRPTFHIVASRSTCTRSGRINLFAFLRF